MFSWSFSAAFDTVDHGILLERLRVTFGVDNSALSWFRSYLAGRQQHVRCSGKCSALTDVICGVPRVGPLAGTLYSLHYWSGVDCRRTWLVATPICWWQPDYTAPVSLMLLRHRRIQCHNVSTVAITGCARTASNSMPTRRSWCGARPFISCRSYPAACSMLLVYQFVLSMPFITFV